jgi:DMSO reductase anchor subunit
VGDYVDLRALSLVVLTSLGGGVGLVALYAFGIRALAAGQDDGRRVASVVGLLSFVLVVVGVLVGLYVLLDKR